MTSSECIEKMREILKKTGNGFYAVSDDPDCECDYGIDGNGNLVIEGGSTFFKLSDLERITYYDDENMDIDEAYIHFYFKDESHIYLYYDSTYCSMALGDKISILLKGHRIDKEVSRNILHSYGDTWRFVGDFLIDNKGVLLSYIGNDKEIIIPEGVKKIGENSFYYARTVESVVLSDSITEIGNDAFRGENRLKKIDLKNVEIIGESAFRARDFLELTLPKSLKKIEKEAFYYCKKELLDNIINNSSVVLDDSIIKVWER